MDNLEFMEKFKPKARCIKDFKYWIVCIRESQTTLGSAVIKKANRICREYFKKKKIINEDKLLEILSYMSN